MDVAIKVFFKTHKSHYFFLHELNVLSTLTHPSLCALLGYCATPEALVFEYYESGNLRCGGCWGTAASRQGDVSVGAERQPGLQFSVAVGAELTVGHRAVG